MTRTTTLFHDSDAFVRCIIGPVGSGKSSACVLEILLRAARQAPGPDGIRRTRFVVIRNTYSQLRDTARKTFEEWIPHECGKWNEQAFTFRIKRGDIDCEVLFRALNRPGDIKKLLSLELTGAWINEAREIPKEVLDILENRVGRYPAKLQGGASWFGIWMDTNPWHTGHWGSKLMAKNLPGYAFFRQPGGRGPRAENVENLPAGYYARLATGKDSEYIKVYIDGEDASGAVGSVFGAWVTDLQKAGGICTFEHPKDGVFTSWDLGRSDSTAIWFWRLNKFGVPDVVDHYEATGEGLAHFFEVVDRKGYTYEQHWLPHDARAKTLATEQSVLEQCVAHWGVAKVAITPNLAIHDGISAARWMLEQPMRIHSRCQVPAQLECSGVDALQEYRFEWDEKAQCFSTNPLHNWASHSGDAFRYIGVVVKNSELMTRRPQTAAPGPALVPVDRSFTLDQMFEDRERELRQRRY